MLHFLCLLSCQILFNGNDVIPDIAKHNTFIDSLFTFK